MGDRRLVGCLLLGGIGAIALSFLGSDDYNNELTLDKAKEIQKARREYHSLSHQYAHHLDGKSLSAGGDAPFDQAKLLRAEKNYHQLQEEIEAIRSSRPWLNYILRAGGFAACASAVLAVMVKRSRKKDVGLDSRSASVIAAYESGVHRRP